MDSVLAPAECFGVVVMLGTRPQKKCLTERRSEVRGKC